MFHPLLHTLLFCSKKKTVHPVHPGEGLAPRSRPLPGASASLPGRKLQAGHGTWRTPARHRRAVRERGYQKLFKQGIYTHSVSTEWFFCIWVTLAKLLFLLLIYMEDFWLVWKHWNLRTLLCYFVTLFIFNPWILHPSTYLWEESQIKGSLYSEKIDTLWSFDSCFSQAVRAILPLSYIPPHTHAAYSKQMLASASATLILKWLSEPYLLSIS